MKRMKVKAGQSEMRTNIVTSESIRRKLPMTGIQLNRSSVCWDLRYQLGYVFLAVWIVSYTRTFLSILANSARAAARLDRPDQHVYKVMAVTGALKDR